NSKEWNFGDDQLRLRWMIYLVVLADVAESVRDTIEFEAFVIDFGGSYQLSIRCAPFEALYGRKCRSTVLWAEIGESSLIGPELVQETNDKVVLIKEKLKAARDRQKICADNRRKPLEFEVGDRVMLKVSPWKGVIRFGKKGKLAPSLHVPLDEIKVDKTLHFVEEPVENSDREVKRLKCSRMVVVKAKWLAVRYLVKVSWNSKCNFELTWVWEDYLKDKFDNQSIERDRLIGIGFVLDFVEFISFTFSDKEMILVIEAGGSPAGIHGLFSEWYCGLASRKVTLGVSMAWAKGVTTGTLVIILRMLKLGRVASKTVGLHAESFS
ncbi:hypothetical protein Tco_1047859, partial [Tanacetum coccineum]